VCHAYVNPIAPNRRVGGPIGSLKQKLSVTVQAASVYEKSTLPHPVRRAAFRGQRLELGARVLAVIGVCGVAKGCDDGGARQRPVRSYGLVAPGDLPHATDFLTAGCCAVSPAGAKAPR